MVLMKGTAQFKTVNEARSCTQYLPLFKLYVWTRNRWPGQFLRCNMTTRCHSPAHTLLQVSMRLDEDVQDVIGYVLLFAIAVRAVA